ncbi:MAG: guanylate kinase [Gammaproteobacteria bacterium AqS3]|nr:guanylate kinase [Gammaproteobacteria bacterium AqS3]
MAGRGNLFIVSGPSGAGKTSLLKAALQRPECSHIRLSISHTTRSSRPGEVDGADYHFTDAGTFQRMREAGEFIESAEVFGHHYGTSRSEVERRLEAGLTVLLEIDCQGALQVMQQDLDSQSVLILPPSLDVLRKRLMDRALDRETVIERRLAGALNEIAQYRSFTHCLVNQNFECTLEELCQVLSGGSIDPAHGRRTAEKLLASPLT